MRLTTTRGETAVEEGTGNGLDREIATTRNGGAVDRAELVRGVSPVLEVPFTEDGEVDYDGFGRVVRHVFGTGVTSVMFPGYASEFLKLSESERTALTGILLDYTREDDEIAAVVAIQDHATHLAIRHARRLADAGADLVNLLPPYQLGSSPAAVRDHVSGVLAAIPEIPVVLQYAPHQTGTSLDAATIGELAREHPNLRLVKVESTPPGTFIAALAAQQPALPAVVGYAGVQLPDALRRGAVGLQPGCSFTEIYVEIWRRHSSGDEVGAAELHRKLLPYISYWMLNSELIVSAEKLISARRGLFASARCRAPGYQLDDEELQMIDRFLDEFADLLPAVV